MSRSLLRIAIWAPLLIAAVLVGGYFWVHHPLAEDSTELTQVALDPETPERTRIGQLEYLGGLDIPRMDQNIGGLSGLRWDATSGRLLAITDDARWVWITPEESGQATLIGLARIESGPLLGLDGGRLEGKGKGDSESLTRGPDATWFVAFERDHRILVYSRLEDIPTLGRIAPEHELGRLESNQGVEAMAAASGFELLCAERQASAEQANCKSSSPIQSTDWFEASPPDEVIGLGGVPTDADALADGTFLILFRSYSPAEGNAAAIVSYAPDGTRRELATLLPPLTVDNFEGLAVREEGERTFLYIVSDDNFSGSQRTLLMKFEVLPESD